MCVVCPVLQLFEDGYEVLVITDAPASFKKIGDDAALRRLKQTEAKIASTAQVISKLTQDWMTPEGRAIATLPRSCSMGELC